MLQTHEEAVTELMALIPQLSYRQLPLLLYQVNSKFRDEMRPRFGLLRGKEFIMKDLYTFDMSAEAANETYKTVSKAYENIFRRIGIQYFKGEVHYYLYCMLSLVY
jgi:prolyl-tRNA synthetase